ncbi:MAG: hypothetical protein WAV11_03210 [Minisyncoccia bacterium]
MIYFLVGDNTEIGIAKAQKVIEALQKKKPDAAYFKIDELTWDESKMEEWIASQGLFASNFLIYVDRVCKNKEAKSYLLKRRKELAESENFFVILEGKLDKDTEGKLAKVAWKTEEFNKPEKTNLTKEEKLEAIGEKIDFFEYADIFASGDKKKIWVMYREAVDKGVPAEEIHSIFFWQARTMLAATLAKNQAESGLKPYPYQKGKSAAENYGEERLRKINSQFVSIYHEAHRGEVDLYNALEKLILEM